MIWFEAEAFCGRAAQNGHLTSVQSAFEIYAINAIVIDTPSISVCDQLWFGANDFEQSGQFLWTDGRPFSYANWGPGQPDLNNQCVSSQARTTGKWKTQPCGTENCFICELFMSSSGSSTPLVPTTTTLAPTTAPPTTPQFTTTMTKPPTTTHLLGCSPGWTSFNRSCYKAFYNAPTWNSAENTCRSNGGHLTSIHSNAENKFNNELTWEHHDDSDYCNQTWIGMQANQDRQWSWTDGSAVDYFFWAPGEPNNANSTTCGIQYFGEYCVQLFTDRWENDPANHFHWNDFACNNPMRAFICKRAPTVL
jgi:hypothetical protein